MKNIKVGQVYSHRKFPGHYLKVTTLSEEMVRYIWITLPGEEEWFTRKFEDIYIITKLERAMK